MFVVICTVDFYFNVSVTCSISCCLWRVPYPAVCDTLMDPWNTCMYVCMYVDTGHQADARKNVRKGLSHVSRMCYICVWLWGGSVCKTFDIHVFWCIWYETINSILLSPRCPQGGSTRLWLLRCRITKENLRFLQYLPQNLRKRIRRDIRLHWRKQKGGL